MRGKTINQKRQKRKRRIEKAQSQPPHKVSECERARRFADWAVNGLKGRIPETTLQCIRYLRRVTPKSTISVEVEKPNREGLVELAAEADVVFYSKSWAEVSQTKIRPWSLGHILYGRDRLFHVRAGRLRDPSWKDERDL